MKKGSRVRPAFEALEDRTTPALLIQLDASGHLTAITGNLLPTRTGVNILQLANNTIDIQEVDSVAGTLDRGTYLAGGNLRVNVGNAINPYTLDVELGAFTYSGSIDLTVGSTANVFGPQVLVNGGTVGGNLSITGGNSNDLVLLGFLAPITVQGSVSINTNGSLPPGVDQVDIGGAGATIGGNLTVTNATFVDVHDATTVGGMLNINDSTKAQDTTVSIDGLAVVSGNAYVTTGGGTDNVTSLGTILGSALFSLGNSAAGIQQFSLGGTVLGSVTYLAGNGADNGTFSGFILGANVTIQQGNGANTLVFGNSFHLGTSMNVIGGNDVDDVTFNNHTAPGARLTMQLGNGNDVVTFTTVPVFASAYIDGGYGVNTFNSPFPNVITYPFTLKNF